MFFTIPILERDPETAVCLPAGITNEYAFGINPMDEETYVLTDNANKGNSTQYVNLADHTGNTNGKMLLVNADVNNYRFFKLP